VAIRIVALLNLIGIPRVKYARINERNAQMDTYIKSRGGRILVVFALAISVLGAGVAYARHIASYDMIVPRFGGAAFTSPLEKLNTSRAVDNNTSIGGNKRVWSSITRGVTNVSFFVWLTSGERVLHSYRPGMNVPGTGYRLRHHSDLLEPVRIQTRGSWSPDER